MLNKQQLIDIVRSSNIDKDAKKELIKIIKNSPEDKDTLMKSLIGYLKISKDYLDLFYDDPSEFLKDLVDYFGT